MGLTLRVIIDGELREFPAVRDTTGDGQADTATAVFNGVEYRCTDFDGDGIPDLIRAVRADDSRAILVRAADSHRYETLSDSNAHDDSVEEGASHWFRQATGYTCGPAAVTMVLADLFDIRLADESQVWQRAIELDAISQDGMWPQDIERVMSSFGIPSQLVKLDTQRLDGLLEKGHEALLMVDAHEFWPGKTERGLVDVWAKLPHVVRVLGVDQRAGVAVISDSGGTNALSSRLELPLDVLNDAWADLDWQAVVTEVTHTQVRAHLDARGVEVIPNESPRNTAKSFVKRATSTIIMPFAVRLNRLREARAAQKERPE